MGFTKLWSNILNSSVWFEPDDVLRTWIYLLAMCGPDGIARTCPPDIAFRCRVDLDRAREIIAILESPDQDSRSPEDDGRRIRRCDGGYFLINYHKYREMRDSDDRKEYMRQYMKNYRSKYNKIKDSVNSVNSCKPLLAQAEAEAEAEEKKKTLLSYSKESDPYKLALYHWTCIQRNFPKFKPPNLQKWAYHIDLMIRIDHRDPDDIGRVIKWCQADEFWKKNILSTEKLRKQFDIIQAKMGGLK